MERLNELINIPEYNQYLEKNCRREEERIFCKHNWNHFINVGRITYVIILERNLSDRLLQEWQLKSEKNQLEIEERLKEIVYTAALLHDIGRWQEYETGRCHAEVSAELAVNLLERCEYDELEKEIILTAIKEHRGEVEAGKSILGRLLCEADNLSRNCKDCPARQRCKSIKNPVIQY